MGRKLNLSTPTVINTELVPLDESFYIEHDGQLEQWYYDNTSQFAPDRTVTPLTLTPKLSVLDSDTKTKYTPSFYTTQWFVNEYNTTSAKYEEREITNTTDSSSAEFVIISGNKLRVKKNVSYTRSITIRCLATYIDPRDSGITYTVQDVVTLTANRDATIVYPDVAISSPSGRTFNPLLSQSSEFSFIGVVTNNADLQRDDSSYDSTATPSSSATQNYVFKWYGVNDSGVEVLADTLPWYVSGQSTNTLVVDAMFGENITVVLRATKSATSNELSPSKAYASIRWRIPDVDTVVQSQNGSAVRSDTTSMTFTTICNVNGNILSDTVKNNHLRFNWKYRKNNSTSESDAGWGTTKTITASNLRNVRGQSGTLASTIVFPYVYVLGAWKTSQGTITGYDKPTTTKGGVTYYRTVD